MDRAKTAVNKSWDALVQHCLLPALEFINQAHDRYDNVQIIAAGSAGVLLLVTGAVSGHAHDEFARLTPASGGNIAATR